MYVVTRLSINKFIGVNMADEVHLLRACTAIRTLTMHFSAPEVAKHIPEEVVALTVNAGSTTTDDLLTQISLRCKKLNRLTILHGGTLRRHTWKGIAAIAKGCTRLRKLVLENNAALVSDLALDLWRDRCPGLEVLGTVSCWDSELFAPTGVTDV